MLKSRSSSTSLRAALLTLGCASGMLILDSVDAAAGDIRCGSEAYGPGSIEVEPSPVTAGSAINIIDSGFEDGLNATLTVCGPDGQVMFFNETGTGFVHRTLIESSWPAGNYTVSMTIEGTKPLQTAVQSFDVAAPVEVVSEPELVVIGDPHVIPGEAVSLLAIVDNLPVDTDAYDIAWLRSDFSVVQGAEFATTYDEPGVYDLVAMAVKGDQRLELPVRIIVEAISCDGVIDRLSVSPDRGPPGTIVDIKFSFVPDADPKFADGCSLPAAEIMVDGSYRDAVGSHTDFEYVARESIDSTATAGPITIAVGIGDEAGAKTSFLVELADVATPVRETGLSARTTNPPSTDAGTSVVGVLPAAAIALIVALSIGAGVSAIARTRPERA